VSERSDMNVNANANVKKARSKRTETVTKTSMKGGAEETIIIEKPTKNTPFISNGFKEVKRSGEAPKGKLDETPLPDHYQHNMKRHGEPIFELKMYEPSPTKIPTIPIPQQTTLPGPGNGQFDRAALQHLLYPTKAISEPTQYNVPMQNVYNISVPGPTGGHLEMNRIYENLLPGKDAKMTSFTVGERLETYSSLRQNLFRTNDGEIISINDSSPDSIFRYIKLLELNRNFHSPITNNPYSGLSYGFLLYRAGYPITLDNTRTRIICARNAIGLNIRLYSLTFEEFYSFQLNQRIYTEFDVWREVMVYEYIREKIIKKRQSPNFPILYAYSIAPEARVDFFALKKKSLTQKEMLTNEYKKFVRKYDLLNLQKRDRSVNPTTVQNSITYPADHPEIAKKVVKKLPGEMDPKLQSYSGNTLVMVTEAPTDNIYQWASQVYKRDGIAMKMINIGTHSPAVWMSIYFQIIHALYVMQVHGIYIRDMTLQDNVYIKDLDTSGKPRGYWKYVVNGVPYYIPNMGYLVYIDSNYKDIVPSSSIEICQREYKIYTTDIVGRKYSPEDIKENIYQNFRRLVNTNCYTLEQTKSMVVRPPDDIISTLESIMMDNERDLTVILSKYFRQFMNNRIGTLLKRDLEVPHVRDISGPLNVGDMVVEEIQANLYRWCQVMAINNDNTCVILTKSPPSYTDFVTKTILINSLREYSKAERIDQSITPYGTFSEEEMLETYIIYE
jgi:hypothetical protein